MKRFLLVLLCCLAALPAAAQQQPYRSQGRTMTAAQEKKVLATYEAEQKAAKAAYQKKPKDAKIKQKYVATTVRLGTAYMTSAVLDAKVKYRMALGKYNEALKVDPNNREAKNNKKMIEDIYRSMGRPIPK